MFLLNFFTSLALLVSLISAEEPASAAANADSSIAEASPTPASPGAFGAVWQHPFESLFRIVPHGEWIWPLGSGHQTDEHVAIKMGNVSEVSTSNVTKKHIVELLLPPVVDKPGVHVHLDGDVLTIIGGYVRHVQSAEGGSQDTFVETRRFAKALRLPYGPVRPEDIKAKLEDGGVLRLEITTQEEKNEGPHQIKVE